MKIANNAVIGKCIDCNSYCYDGEDKKKGTIHCARNAFKTVDRKTIDEGCPLKDCFILKQPVGEKATIELLKEWGLLESKNLDYIIIVKKMEAGK